MSGKWIPLESNPEWSEKAGLLTTQDNFYDIYGLDPELLSFVPQPVKAVIVLFPITPKFEEIRKEEDESIKNKKLPAVDPTVIWIKQTISNACGTIGLLHALMNSPVAMKPDCALSEFIDACKAIKSPEERAKLLEETHLFANMHSEAASSGQSAVPSNLDTENHFTCFVQAPSSGPDEARGAKGMRLVELDGRRAGPIDRGASENLLMDAARFVKENFIAQSENINISMIALAANSGDD
ncbi:peptidase C12 ubiquitin carboxyl-terminal hydrolase 1 [Schizopora paradoxa]|uniref:Ubiquitin carboxyl-terminal hydrolase n=1 Tax=Schizopora paradoxa TaxID=27342 RepID=A0A0H2RIS0_9AGAM|nr:peptidase C12 ubiquitin carboxyl-terminal hydrolase 1 [Schizopora paradoxa]